MGPSRGAGGGAQVVLMLAQFWLCFAPDLSLGAQLPCGPWRELSQDTGIVYLACQVLRTRFVEPPATAVGAAAAEAKAAPSLRERLDFQLLSLKARPSLAGEVDSGASALSEGDVCGGGCPESLPRSVAG